MGHLQLTAECVGAKYHWQQNLEQDTTVNDKSNAGRFDPESLSTAILYAIDKDLWVETSAFDLSPATVASCSRIGCQWYQRNYDPLQHYW